MVNFVFFLFCCQQSTINLLIIIEPKKGQLFRQFQCQYRYRKKQALLGVRALIESEMKNDKKQLMLKVNNQ